MVTTRQIPGIRVPREHTQRQEREEDRLKIGRTTEKWMNVSRQSKRDRKTERSSSFVYKKE